MRKEVKLPAEAVRVKPVGKFLCLYDVSDFKKRVIIHLVRDAVFIKGMLHHLTSININLDQEREPCLELDMHEAEMLIKKIDVKIFAFTVNSVEGKQPVAMLLGLKCLTVFHYRENADEPFIQRMFLKDL